MTVHLVVRIHVSSEAALTLDSHEIVRAVQLPKEFIEILLEIRPALSQVSGILLFTILRLYLSTILIHQHGHEVSDIVVCTMEIRAILAGLIGKDVTVDDC
jgi:hypothetical protein